MIISGNVAYQKTASQSGTSFQHPPELAVDGDTYQKLDAGRYCANPSGGTRDNPAWWQVDLGQEHVVYNVTVIDRIECCSGKFNFSFNINVKRKLFP